MRRLWVYITAEPFGWDGQWPAGSWTSSLLLHKVVIKHPRLKAEIGLRRSILPSTLSHHPPQVQDPWRQQSQLNLSHLPSPWLFFHPGALLDPPVVGRAWPSVRGKVPSCSFPVIVLGGPALPWPPTRARRAECSAGAGAAGTAPTRPGHPAGWLPWRGPPGWSRGGAWP